MTRRRSPQQTRRTLFGGQEPSVRRRVALYARVSTDEQREAGTIQTQLGKLRDRARIEDTWEPVGEYVDDGVSGTVPLDERPAGRRLMADAAAGKFDQVVVYRLDRLARKLTVMVDAHDSLRDCGVALVSATEPFDTASSIGQFVFQLLGGLAELERSTIRERTFGGRDRVAGSGRWVTGPIPPGYDLDAKGFLTPNRDGELWTTVFRRIAWEGASAVGEAQRLTALGIPTTVRYPAPGGTVNAVAGAGYWAPSRLRDILHNPVYKGTRRFQCSGDTLSETPCPALVDGKTWDRVQVRLKENKRLSKKGAVRDYLLRGLVFCKDCGGAYSGWPHNGQAYYRCGTQVRSYTTRRLGAPEEHIATCRAKMIPAAYLEEIVWQRCVWIILHAEEAWADAQKVLRERMAGARDTTAEQADLRRKIGEHQRSMDRQKVLYRKGLSDVAETERVVLAERAQIAALEADLADLAAEHDLARFSEQQAAQFAADIARLPALLERVEQEGDMAAKREIVERLIAGLRITTAGEGRSKEATVEVVPYLGDPSVASLVRGGPRRPGLPPGELVVYESGRRWSVR